MDRVDELQRRVESLERRTWGRSRSVPLRHVTNWREFRERTDQRLAELERKTGVEVPLWKEDVTEKLERAKRVGQMNVELVDKLAELRNASDIQKDLIERQNGVIAEQALKIAALEETLEKTKADVVRDLQYWRAATRHRNGCYDVIDKFGNIGAECGSHNEALTKARELNLGRIKSLFGV
jgi:hypothetical protein